MSIARKHLASIPKRMCANFAQTCTSSKRMCIIFLREIGTNAQVHVSIVQFASCGYPLRNYFNFPQIYDKTPKSRNAFQEQSHTNYTISKKET